MKKELHGYLHAFCDVPKKDMVIVMGNYYLQAKIITENKVIITEGNKQYPRGKTFFITEILQSKNESVIPVMKKKVEIGEYYFLEGSLCRKTSLEHAEYYDAQGALHETRLPIDMEGFVLIKNESYEKHSDTALTEKNSWAADDDLL